MKSQLIWKSSSSFLEHYLSIQIAYLIKTGFKKHIIQVMVHSYEIKRNSQA